MRASSRGRCAKTASSVSSRSSSRGVSQRRWLGAYLACVEIRSYEASPEPNPSAIRSLSSGCEGATTASTSTPSRAANSSRRPYRGSYIGPPTNSTRKPLASASVATLRAEMYPQRDAGSTVVSPRRRGSAWWRGGVIRARLDGRSGKGVAGGRLRACYFAPPNSPRATPARYSGLPEGGGDVVVRYTRACSPVPQRLQGVPRGPRGGRRGP